MPHSLLRPLVLFAALAFLLLVPGRDASARLEPKEWRQLQEDTFRLFSGPGHSEGKAVVVDLLVRDGERRAWKLLVDCLVKEAAFGVDAVIAVRQMEDQIDAVQSKPMAKRYPEEQENLVKWQAELVKLEKQAQEEEDVLDKLTRAVAGGPRVLRKNLFNRARGPVSWAVRAAAARVAAVNPDEKLSFEFLSRVLTSDKDARVRMAALESLRAQKPVNGENGGDEKNGDDEEATNEVDVVESLVLGRLGDPDWGVQLLAVRIVANRKMTQAVPHLINAMTFGSPRVVEALAEVLREFTGENFDPYADVWARWWADHQDEYESDQRVKTGKNPRSPSDAHFYGLPVRSDRILFIIDASSSMKLPTKNENPAEKWKPQGPVTGPDAPPPPPPPEEILSGPKIDVAKHELKKALLRLPPSTMFNIVAFNSAVLRWKDEMTQATDKNRKDALQWVRALTPKGSTYIDGALRLAFRMAGLGAVDRAYPEVNIDTMILLSDGAPTDDGYPKAKFMEPEIILEHVRKWNRHKRIVIHAIGVDMVEGIEFLRKLAEENGGKYVDR